MAVTKRRYPKEEIVKRGEEIFERSVKQHLKRRARLHFVVIDIETGDFEVDADHLAANDRLRELNPNAQIYARERDPVFCMISVAVFGRDRNNYRS